mmetsp:Transcript_38548/g.90572  ORF Transcript_38548/g.90572 Transcript_38548/m.90572 type:complete len:329 (+) Transcript_38548:274-1260(+)
MHRVLLVLLHKGVWVVSLHGCEGVVHIAVVALVCEHALQDVHPHRVLLQLPVHNGQLWCGEVVPLLVERSSRCLDLMDNVRVGHASSFLQVANKAMHSSWVHQVNRCQEWSHHNLGSLHQAARHETCLKAGHADQQVHTFVLGFLQQSVNPSVISLQRAQRPEVTKHCGKEARYTCHTLQNDQPSLHSPDRGIHRLEASHPVETAVQTPHGGVHNPIPFRHRPVLPEILEALLDFLLAPDVVGDAVPQPAVVLCKAIVATEVLLVRLDLQWVWLLGFTEVHTPVVGSPGENLEGRCGCLNAEWCHPQRDASSSHGSVTQEHGHVKKGC